MIPLRDEIRSLTTPHVTRMLLVANIIVFFITFLPDLSSPYWFYYLLGAGDSPALYSAIMRYGLIPGEVVRGDSLFTLFTSMFLHADLIHLGGNMLFLYIFGDNVEDTFGHARYLIFYLFSGIFASAAHIFFALGSSELFIPTIGASGAISGVMGAYLVLYPKSRILTLILLYWISIVAIPAVVFLGLWFAFQFLYGTLAAGGGVAYWAHVGGFVVGLFFGFVWRGRRRKRDF